MVRHLLVALLALCLATVAVAGESPSEVSDDLKFAQASAVAYIDDDRGEALTRAIALNNAKRTVLEKVVGINLHSSSVIYNGDLVSELVSAAAKGVVIEKSVSYEKGMEDGRFFIKANLEAYVKPFNETRGSLKILAATVQRPENGSAVSPVFQNNDEVQIRVMLNEDAYVSIFSVDQYGMLARIVPNQYVKSESVPARKELVFPDDLLRGRGLRIRVTTPKNLSRSMESALIIATKEEPHFLENPELINPTIADLMKELSDLRTSWTEKTVGYEVRR